MQPIETIKRIYDLAKKAKNNANFYGKIKNETPEQYANSLYWTKFWRLKELRYLKLIHDQRTQPVGQTALGAKIIADGRERLEYLIFLVGNSAKPKIYNPVTEENNSYVSPIYRMYSSDAYAEAIRNSR